MNMKNINDLLNMTLRRKQQIVKPKPKINPNPRSMMNEVVPSLTREDFLSQWKQDVTELNKTKAELDKYKKIVNTRFSSDWKEELNDKNKKKT